MNLLIWQVTFLACFSKLVHCGVMENFIENTDAGGKGKIAKDKFGACPEQNSKFPVYLPDPDDCSRFFICDSGIPHMKKCFPGLHFNPKINACDYPKNAKCDADVGEKGKGKIAKEKFGACPEQNSKFPVYLPDPDDCSRFFICDSGIPHMKKCLPGLHFNPKINACDYPKNAKCDADADAKTKGRNTDEDLWMCPTEDSITPLYLPHPDDCNKFYICDNGSPILKACHPKLYFNPKINACDFPQNVDCEREIRESSIMSDALDICQDENTGYFLHLDDCNKFYMCYKGLALLKECPPGLHFNPKHLVCDFPQNVRCDTGVSKALRGRSLNDRFIVCPDEESPGNLTLYPHPTDCAKFYECDHGIPVLKSCEPGLSFNGNIQACDLAENTVCEKETSLAFAGVPSPFCPSEDGKIPIFYRHPTNCTVYYMCGNGLAYEFVCPARLHFNLRKRVCDYEENAKCRT